MKAKLKMKCELMFISSKTHENGFFANTMFFVMDEDKKIPYYEIFTDKNDVYCLKPVYDYNRADYPEYIVSVKTINRLIKKATINYISWPVPIDEFRKMVGPHIEEYRGMLYIKPMSQLMREYESSHQ